MASRKRNGLQLAVAGLGLLAAAPWADAAGRSWSNTNGGVYNDGKQWTPGSTVPSGEDSAVFDVNGAYTITVNATRTAKRFLIGKDKLVLDLVGKSLIFNSTTYSSFAMGLSANDAARLTIRNGTLVNNLAILGSIAKSSANVTVSTGGIWNSLGALSIGHAGTGGMTVTGGGKVSSDSGRVGIYAKTIGNVMVSSANSTWDVARDLYVGGTSSNATTVAGEGNVMVRWGATLNVGGLLNVQKKGVFTLDNGTATVGRFTSTGKVAFNAGTLNITKSDLLIGNSGPLTKNVSLNSSRTLNVTRMTNITTGAKLIVEGGRFSAGGVNNSGEIEFNGSSGQFTSPSLNNYGLLHGTGIATVDSITNYGRLEAIGADNLKLNGAVANHGSILFDSGGTMEFGSSLSNESTGSIRGSGTLTVPGGLRNAGSMTFDSGTARVDSALNNVAGGQIQVSGSALVPSTVVNFLQSVIHNGQQFRVAQDSTAVFNGNVSGAGSFTGTGRLLFQSGYSPGNSPAHVTIEGSVDFGAAGELLLEMGPGGDYDQLSIGLSAVLDDVSIVGDPAFTPVLDVPYVLVSADSIDYNGDVGVASMPAGFNYTVNQGQQALTITFTAIPEPSMVGLALGAALLPLTARRRRR